MVSSPRVSLTRDFSLARYGQLLDALLERGTSFGLFREALEELPSEPFCLLRHDVDRMPRSSLAMGLLEAERGIRASYYFRDVPSSLDPEVVTALRDAGHEIGFHYESLSQASGNKERALDLFGASLEKLRDLAEVKTICMHGRPLSPHDNRDLWRGENHALLKERFELSGELYLDLDYRSLAYVSDTGRTWKSGGANLRDHVGSEVDVHCEKGEDLLRSFREGRWSRLIFQVHPERWPDSLQGWAGQWMLDSGFNLAKQILRRVR